MSAAASITICAMAGAPGGSAAAELLERDAELAGIDDELIAAAGAGEGRFLVIEGRSGVGKTSLLAEQRRRGQRAGMSVCAARENQSGQCPPRVTKSSAHTRETSDRDTDDLMPALLRDCNVSLDSSPRP